MPSYCFQAPHSLLRKIGSFSEYLPRVYCVGYSDTHFLLIRCPGSTTCWNTCLVTVPRLPSPLEISWNCSAPDGWKLPRKGSSLGTARRCSFSHEISRHRHSHPGRDWRISEGRLGEWVSHGLSQNTKSVTRNTKMIGDFPGAVSVCLTCYL